MKPEMEKAEGTFRRGRGGYYDVQIQFQRKNHLDDPDVPGLVEVEAMIRIPREVGNGMKVDALFAQAYRVFAESIDSLQS